MTTNETDSKQSNFQIKWLAIKCAYTAIVHEMNLFGDKVFMHFCLKFCNIQLWSLNFELIECRITREKTFPTYF